VEVGLARSRVTAIPSFDTVILSRYQKLFSLSSLTQPAKGVSLHYHQAKIQNITSIFCILVDLTSPESNFLLQKFIEAISDDNLIYKIKSLKN